MVFTCLRSIERCDADRKYLFVILVRGVDYLSSFSILVISFFELFSLCYIFLIILIEMSYFLIKFEKLIISELLKNETDVKVSVNSIRLFNCSMCSKNVQFQTMLAEFERMYQSRNNSDTYRSIREEYDSSKFEYLDRFRFGRLNK